MNSPVSPIFEMEMERLDMEIDKARKKFYSAVLGKKRKVKRTWLEISSLTNAHLLQMLPYRAMLGHVAKLAEERDEVIAQIVADNDKEFDENEIVDDAKINSNEVPPENVETPEGIKLSSAEEHISSESLSSNESREEETHGAYARDEAVQTDESSFSS